MSQYEFYIEFTNENLNLVWIYSRIDYFKFIDYSILLLNNWIKEELFQCLEYCPTQLILRKATDFAVEF